MISPPIGSSTPADIVMSEPGDDPKPALHGIVFVFCRCFGLSLVFLEASAGDLDEDLRRRAGLEDVGVWLDADETPVGRVFDFIVVD